MFQKSNGKINLKLQHYYKSRLQKNESPKKEGKEINVSSHGFCFTLTGNFSPIII